MVQPLDLRRRHARKTLDPKQRVGIGKGSEARTVYLDRRAGLFGHLLPDATRLHDRDAVTDDEGAGGLIGRVKEHRSKMCVLGLQPADNGIAASDLGKTLAIDIERDGRHGLLPGALRVGPRAAINIAGDRRSPLPHQYRRGIPPAFDGKGHDDGVAEPRPAAEVARFDLEVEGSRRNKLEMRERRDEVYSSAAARLP